MLPRKFLFFFLFKKGKRTEKFYSSHDRTPHPPHRKKKGGGVKHQNMPSLFRRKINGKFKKAPNPDTTQKPVLETENFEKPVLETTNSCIPAQYQLNEVLKTNSKSGAFFVTGTKNETEAGTKNEPQGIIAKISFHETKDFGDKDNSLKVEAEIYKHLKANNICPNLVEPLEIFDTCQSESLKNNLLGNARNAFDTFLNKKNLRTDRYQTKMCRVIILKRSAGTTLSEFFKKSPGITEKILADVLFQVAGALLQFQRIGLMHNDLHTGNIFIEKTNETEIKYEEKTRTVSHFIRIYDFDRAAKVQKLPDDKIVITNNLIKTEIQKNTKKNKSQKNEGSNQFKEFLDWDRFMTDTNSHLQKRFFDQNPLKKKTREAWRNSAFAQMLYETPLTSNKEQFYKPKKILETHQDSATNNNSL